MFSYLLRYLLCYYVVYHQSSSKHSRMSFFSNKVLKIFGHFGVDYDFPLQINLELSRSCNLKCTFCPREQASQYGNIDFKVAKKVIDEATCLKKPTVFGLHMWGEPLLNPDIFKIIKYIKQSHSGHRVTLTTNGFLLNSKKSADLLATQIDQVIVSYHSDSSEKMKELIGRDLEKSVLDSNIKSLIKLKSQQGVNTNIVIRTFGDDVSINNFEGASREDKEYDNSAGHTPNFSRKLTVNNRWPCYRLWLTTTIAANGDITPCCVDLHHDLKLGNIKETNLKTAWSGYRLKEMRQQHIQNKFSSKCDICKGCDTWQEMADLGIRSI